MITQNELLKIAAISKAQLHSILFNKSIDEALVFRRNLQVALAEYAKHNKYDICQANILSVINQVESWARAAYFKKRLPEVLRSDTSLLRKGKASAKAIIAKEWEAEIKQRSY